VALTGALSPPERLEAVRDALVQLQLEEEEIPDEPVPTYAAFKTPGLSERVTQQLVAELKQLGREVLTPFVRGVADKSVISKLKPIFIKYMKRIDPADKDLRRRIANEAIAQMDLEEEIV